MNLAFLSGNEVYWKTRWETSIDGSGTPYRTLVTYKEIKSGANTDPNDTTSTWRDPVYGPGLPENSLTGTMFTVDSYRLDTITIPYALSNFRFWTNTAVDDLQPGQVYSLTPNLLGYEWDSDLDNGFRPAGLINLSSTTLQVEQKLLDYGSIVGSGTSTHALTLYRAESGALVFSAGSVYWAWGLDEHHDLEETPVDPNVQQAMVNLLADMGVQPDTLMASLALASQSTDHGAPTSTIATPSASVTIPAYSLAALLPRLAPSRRWRPRLGRLVHATGFDIRPARSAFEPGNLVALRRNCPPQLGHLFEELQHQALQIGVR